MGIAVSLILIAAGAILAWGVNADLEGIDIDVVGWVLMIVGLVSFLLTLLFWQSWWGPGYWRRGRTSYVEEGPPAQAYGDRRRTYVEEEVDDPAVRPPPP